MCNGLVLNMILESCLIRNPTDLVLSCLVRNPTDWVLDESVDVTLGRDNSVFAGSLFIVGTAVFVCSDLAFEVPPAIKTFADLLTGIIIGGAPGTSAEVAVMTALEFTLPAPLEDSSISC